MTETPVAASPSVRARAIRWARILVAVALIGFLAWRAGFSDVPAMVAQVEPGWLALGLLLVPLAVLVRAYNHSLLINYGEHVIGLADMTRLTYVGVGINLFLPMGAADLAKAHYGYRVHGHAERMIVSSILDKVTSLTAVALLGVAGALVSGQPVMAAIAAAVAIGSLLPFVAPRLMPWRLLLRVLAPRAEISEELLASVARVPLPLLVKVYAVSVVGWLVTYTIVYLSCLGAGATVGPAYVFALAPLATLAKLIPISAGGIGLGEVTMAALLARAGVPSDLAALASLLQMALVTFVPGVVGLLLLARGRD